MAKYASLSIRTEVAEKFKIFAKKNQKEYSDVLLQMIYFLEDKDIDIFDEKENALSVNKLINKRFNALVSIIKNIEKTQTKPTANLMAILFEQLAEETDSQKNNSELRTKAKFTERKQ